MNFRQAQVEKVKNRIKKKVKIFPSWDGRGLDDKRKEYEAHMQKYTYPMDELQKEVSKEAGLQPRNEVFQNAKSQLNKLEEDIHDIASALVEQALSSGISDCDQIKDHLIDRIADDIMINKSHECVITVPDLWFPEY